MTERSDRTRARFLELLGRAFDGWQANIEADFSQSAFDAELRSLGSYDVYQSFGLAVPEYVLIRLTARVSTTVARRLATLYDNLPRLATASRFGLHPTQVAARVAGLNLDLCVPFNALDDDDRDSVVAAVVAALGLDVSQSNGLGIEIRYKFDPSDGARFRKDVVLVEGLFARGLVPIYLVYNRISSTNEAVRRLVEAGWQVLIAQPAADFTTELLDLDLFELLAEEDVKKLISEGVDRMMVTMLRSAASRGGMTRTIERPRKR